MRVLQHWLFPWHSDHWSSGLWAFFFSLAYNSSFPWHRQYFSYSSRYSFQIRSNNALTGSGTLGSWDSTRLGVVRTPESKKFEKTGKIFITPVHICQYLSKTCFLILPLIYPAYLWWLRNHFQRESGITWNVFQLIPESTCGACPSFIDSVPHAMHQVKFSPTTSSKFIKSLILKNLPWI